MVHYHDLTCMYLKKKCNNGGREFNDGASDLTMAGRHSKPGDGDPCVLYILFKRRLKCDH